MALGCIHIAHGFFCFQTFSISTSVDHKQRTAFAILSVLLNPNFAAFEMVGDIRVDGAHRVARFSCELVGHGAARDSAGCDQ